MVDWIPSFWSWLRVGCEWCGKDQPWLAIQFKSITRRQLLLEREASEKCHKRSHSNVLLMSEVVWSVFIVGSLNWWIKINDDKSSIIYTDVNAIYGTNFNESWTPIKQPFLHECTGANKMSWPTVPKESNHSLCNHCPLVVFFLGKGWIWKFCLKKTEDKSHYNFLCSWKIVDSPLSTIQVHFSSANTIKKNIWQLTVITQKFLV